RSVISINEAANAIFAAGNTDQHEVFDHQRRKRDAITGAMVSSRDVPNDVSCFCVERDDVRVERAQKNSVAKNREPAVYPPAPRTNVRRQRTLILPDRPARARIERKRSIIRASGIEHSINDEWRGLKFSSGHGLVGP